MLLESVARPLLIAHALAGSAVVALTTHHLVWIVRSRGARRRGEPRFALLASGAFLTAFFLGSALYPTYRVRVRAEYLDAPAARDEERALRHAHEKAAGPALRPVALERVARVFDVKESLIALGLLCSLGLLWLSRRADPSDLDERVLYVGLGACACAAAWSAWIIGVYTASVRAVGAA